MMKIATGLLIAAILIGGIIAMGAETGQPGCGSEVVWSETADPRVGSPLMISRPEGFVPNENSAVQIAKAVLGAVYERVDLASYEPYTADLVNGVWYVQGTPREGWLGGPPTAKIRKCDGLVLGIVTER